MKWIIYLVAGCAIYDVNAINSKNNFSFSDLLTGNGAILLTIVLIVIHTAIAVHFIEKRDWLDTRQTLSVFLLAVPMLFLFVHIFVVLYYAYLLLVFIDGLWK